MTDKPTIDGKFQSVRSESPTAADEQRTPDAEQHELWRRYLEQQARRSCPGCGETEDAVL